MDKEKTKLKKTKDLTFEDLDGWLCAMCGKIYLSADNDDIVNAIQLNNTILLKILKILEEK